MIDFIGDIHGHADKLEALLKKLGYSIKNGSYRHSERSVIFVGDYIDRGPMIIETLKIVRGMVDAGSAIALMGNHEYNAICFHLPNSRKGGHLRPHLLKNIHQHVDTIRQFHDLSDGGQEQYKDYINWFRTLPLYYETSQFRAVHACWDIDNIKFLKERLKNGFDDNLIWESLQKENKLYTAIDETLKGKEIPVPLGQEFKDKERNTRTEMRIKWWENPLTTTYRDLSFPRVATLPDELVDKSLLKSTKYYTDQVPVFFGHYWLKGKIEDYGSNICCLDYSVAKGGVLAAYQFDGEARVDIRKFVYV